MSESSGRASNVQLSWVRANNPGPTTLGGTHTYLITASHTLWIVDPGPDDRDHAQAVLDAAVGSGARHVGGIVVTHHHEDHIGALGMVRRALNAATGISIPVWAADPRLVPGASDLPSELSARGDRAAEIIHLPGHTADSIGVLVEGGRMLTGDAVLGGSPTTICALDALGDYLQVLQILRVMCLDGRISGIYPGHGRIIESPNEALAEIERQLSHRQERIAQVHAARERGALTVTKLLKELYEPDFERRLEAGEPAQAIEKLRAGATANVRAALEYLKQHPPR